MNDKAKIIICSDIDYDELIAEIYYEDRFVALLSQEEGGGSLMIEFPAAHNSKKTVNLDWFLEAISTAKNKLLES